MTITKILDSTNQIYREDGRIEQLCEHGVGHPIGHRNAKMCRKDSWIWVHGCDGCCNKFPEIEYYEETHLS